MDKWILREIIVKAQSYYRGHDTTANSLICLVWAVCRRSEVKDTESTLPEARY